MKIVSIVAVLFACFACSSNDGRRQSGSNVEYQIFRRNENLTFDGLKREGFEKEEAVDVYNLVKQLNDSTTLTYFIDDSSKLILSQIWTINFSKYDKNELNNFLRENDVLIITTLCDIEQFNFVDFFVENFHKKNSYYRCRFEKVATGAILIVKNSY